MVLKGSAGVQVEEVIAFFFPRSCWGGEVEDPGNEIVLAVACSRLLGCHSTLHLKVPFGRGGGGGCMTSRKTAAKETSLTAYHGSG